MSLNVHVEAQAQEQQSRHLKIKAATPKASSWLTNSLSHDGVFSSTEAKRCWWCTRTWTKSSLSQSNTMCSSSWTTCQSIYHIFVAHMDICFRAVKSLLEGYDPRGVCMKEHVTNGTAILFSSSEVTSASCFCFEDPSILV